MRIAAPAACVLVVVILAGCGRRSAGPDGSGTIECTQVVVSPQVAGRIVKIVPQEGAAVRKGDQVATIDPTDFELRRREAGAMLAGAQAQLDLLVAGTREEDVQRAREQVREAQAVAGAAKTDLGRMEELFKKNSIPRKQLDDAQAQAERTAAMLSGAEQTLARLLHGSRREEIRAAQAMVDQTGARLAMVDKAVADCVVVAPADGVVTTRSREEGEFAGPGTAIVTISRLDDVWLSIYVPENRIAKARLGSPASVRIDGVDTVFKGVVSFVSQEAEFTPKNVQTSEERSKLVYRVKIALRNPDGVFKPGMPADGYLDVP
ncbi:MAG: efflux RND transporter periplasmic adaptor subunit [bacterium]